MQFTPVALDTLRRIVREGVANVDVASDTSGSTNARKLGDEIVRVAREQQTTTVSQGVVRTALNRLCPLWPFC
jgi:hypothetical protein